MIILLCGPPGVGKTLTAESVAEEMRVPVRPTSMRTCRAKLTFASSSCTCWLQATWVSTRARSRRSLKVRVLLSLVHTSADHSKCHGVANILLRQVSSKCAPDGTQFSSSTKQTSSWSNATSTSSRETSWSPSSSVCSSTTKASCS